MLLLFYLHRGTKLHPSEVKLEKTDFKSALILLYNVKIHEILSKHFACLVHAFTLLFSYIVQ